MWKYFFLLYIKHVEKIVLCSEICKVKNISQIALPCNNYTDDIII